MKSSIKIFAYLFALAIVVLNGMACSENNAITSSDLINESNTVALSEQETADLLFLREEEKLAHDVYLFAYATHGLTLFNNIASSEQQHTDRVKALLDQYGIADPALANAGEFTNETLQELYNQLTAKAAISLTDALEVGATIEDLDIKDLNLMAVNSQREDLALLYENLACGSANHMRSFYGQLQNLGVTYQVQYITNEALTAILSASNGGCGR